MLYMALAPGSAEHRRHYATFAAAAYGQDVALPEGFTRDPELSNRNRQVYVNMTRKELVLAERGTMPRGNASRAVADLSTDAALAVGVQELTPRFKNARTNAKKALGKYPGYQATATGHSLGAGVAHSLHNKLGVDAVTFSAYTPPNRVHRDAITGLLGKNRVRGQVNYTTALDPISIGTTLSGRSHIVAQSHSNPHALANFLA